MKRLALVPLAVLALAVPAHAEPPAAHVAAVCADYSNQAAAQHAADTRDSDGDGVYCESLPCPCAGPGSSAPAPPVHHPAKPKRKPALFNGRCQRGRLPDKSCSPGKAATTDTQRICAAGYSERVRNVSASLKQRVYYAYGIRRHARGSYEMDHIIPLELGGSNARANLFPEAARPSPGFHEKDRLENELHQAVCQGELGLADAQRMIASNWLTAYKRFFG
jgi:hypothetical protein